MRNQLKRALSLLLAVIMVLGLLPVVAFAAGETYVATAASGIPAGKDVAIYCPSDKFVWGSEVSDSIGAKGATLEGDKLTVSEGTGVYRFVKNADGTYYITKAGKYLTATSTSAINMKDAASAEAKWRIEATEGGYHIINATVKYNSRDLYMEYYGNAFKFYSYKDSTAAIYVMSFYELPAEADADGDGRVGGPIGEAGPLPEAGTKVVIYNDYAGGVVGLPTDNGALDCVASTLSGNEITVGNGGMIFDVSINADGYYVFSSTFSGVTTYMCTSEGGNDLFMSETENECTQWEIVEGQAGWRLKNKTAKYNGKSDQFLEFFAEAFKTYSYYSSTPEYYAFNFYTVEDADNRGYVLNPTMSIIAQNAFKGIDYEFKMELDELSEVMSVEMTASVDGGTPFTVADTAIDGYKYTYAIDGDKLTGSKLTLKGTATNEYDMTYSAEVTVDISDEPVILSVTPASNVSTDEDKRPEITIEIANCGTNPTVEMSIDGTKVSPKVTADKITYKPTADLIDGRHVVAVSITRADGKTAEMTWSFNVGEGGLNLYYGQMHSHTAEYSDGAGTLEDAYEYAMKADDIDYMFVTDHSNYFDTTATATTKSYYDLSSLSKVGSLTKWEEAKQTALGYNSESFVAGYGYEMTWSGGPGHTNSFNTYGTISRNNSELNNKTDYAGMHRYNDLMAYANQGLDIDGNPVAEGVKTKYIEEAPVVSQFNHPGTTFGNFDNFAGYTPARDSVLTLIEVGNGEGAIGGSSYWPSYSQYDLALSKGWHVAPTNNQDNHKGKWGDANTARDVIVTEDFTEAGLYKAMSERRVYATEDQNLRIYYYLNDALMGSIIPIEDGEEITKVTVKASISDPDGEGLGKIEVIGENGVTKYSVNAAGATYELNVELDNTDAYYYIKITQADNDIAVTAPVWVGEATPITATIESTSKIIIKGEPETIFATLTNAAENEYKISKIQYTTTIAGEETVLFTDTEAKTVAAGESLRSDFQWTFTEPGNYTVTVVFTGTYKDKAFTVKAEAVLKVPDGVMRIGVDYGHDNYYLSGDYKDNAGNFIDFCADNGVVCEEIKAGEFTYETISQYNLIVLTVPYLRNNAKANTYNEEELEALRRYAAEGKNLIVCSKSDRDNKFDNCADNSNAILEAIGAHSRVVNGIIVDNEQKANEAYRLYFSGIENFNTEHPFTKGAYTSSNAFGTVSEPSNQTGFQVYNGGPIEIMEGYENVVETLVRGYDTTWGSHYDGYFTGSAFVPEYDEADESKVTVKMGDVNIMTYEKLAAGGWVVTSGVTFFSNYDIKNDQDYANRFILLNILRSLKEEEVVTPIATVKKQSEGEFTVEGFVTSNASAYDQDTAFFDCIYIQDEEGNGLNIFPVAGNYCVGMEVACHGGITFYCGEVELNLSTDYNGSIRIISDEINVLEPARVTCKEAMSDATIGNLMKVGGKVVDLHYTEGVVDKIFVQDATGIACVFINGYINKVYTGLDNLSIGDMVYATGIGSRDVDEASLVAAVFARLRVRTRDEIIIVEDNTCEHKWGEAKVVVAATCMSEGTNNYTCETCGEIRIENVSATGEHTFANGACTVCGQADPNKIPFGDVKASDYYYDPVLWAVAKGITTGTSADKFSPEKACTRGQIVTFLWRAAGSPAPKSNANPFSDIKESDYFYKAVLWAVEEGITSGTGKGKFSPNNECTRAQVATFLWRAQGKPAPTSGTNAFTDIVEGSYYYEAVLWAVEMGITNGTGNGKFSPDNSCTRGQIVTFLYRALK